MEHKFGMAGDIYRLTRSMHDFGVSDDAIMMTIRQTLELQDKPVDDKEIKRLVEAALSHTDDKRGKAKTCKPAETVYSREYLRSPEPITGVPERCMRLHKIMRSAEHDGIDPVFWALVRHAESRWTERRLNEAFLTIMRGLKADCIRVECDGENLEFKITVKAGDRRYTSMTHWGENDNKIVGADLTGHAAGIEEWTCTDRYTMQDGLLMVNGLRVERG